MKNKNNNNSVIGQIEKAKLETAENELPQEQDINLKIAVKSYQEPSRPYFSSPCMLSELEDGEEVFNQ